MLRKTMGYYINKVRHPTHNMEWHNQGDKRLKPTRPPDDQDRRREMVGYLEDGKSPEVQDVVAGRN